jgi:ubiquinone/menaquinone biosynthesis C-methylase UbiE
MNFHSQVCQPTGVQGIMMARHMNANRRGMMEWALDHLDVSDICNVLDVGCGGGGPMSQLSRKASKAKFTGLDLSKDMLRMTSKVNATAFREGRLRTVRGSVSSLPFRNGSFDTVFACETTYFWPDLRENLRECRRVVSDQGRMVLVQEAWDAPQWRERNEYWQKGFNMRFCSLEEYEDLLFQAGFAEVVTVTEEDEGWFVMVASAEGN